MNDENKLFGDPYELLYGGICEQAVKDLRAAYLMGDRGKQRQKALERFFRSEWFMWLTHGNIDGEYVIEKVRKQCRMSKHS